MEVRGAVEVEEVDFFLSFFFETNVKSMFAFSPVAFERRIIYAVLHRGCHRKHIAGYAL